MIIAEDSDYQWILEEDDDKINRDLDNLYIDDESNMDVESVQESVQDDDEPYYSILCIDVGVVNLGLSALIADPITLKFKKIVGIDLLDITKILHPEHIPECKCTLNHTKTFTDWMEHLFQYYHDIFEAVDKIIIERQPPKGFVVVEQLIYSKYRNKCELISPASLHKFFHMSTEYDIRKEESIQIASRHLERVPPIYQEFKNFNRKHDIADSILMGLFWFHNEHHKYREKEHQKYISSLTIKTNQWGGCPKEMNIDDFLAQFRFNPLQPPNTDLFLI